MFEFWIFIDGIIFVGMLEVDGFMVIGEFRLVVKFFGLFVIVGISNGLFLLFVCVICNFGDNIIDIIVVMVDEVKLFKFMM